MAYQRRKTESEKIELWDLDPSGETTITIRHATGKDELQVEQIESSREVTYNLGANNSAVEKAPTPESLIRARKVWVVLEECDILDEDNNPYFSGKDSWTRFLEKWNDLVYEETQSIFDAVLQVNPHWGN